MEEKAAITPLPTGKTLLVPLYHLELVKDRELPYDGAVGTTEQAAQVLHALLDRSVTEQFAVLYLDSTAKIIGAERVGMGGMESVQTNQTEIIRGALVAGVPEILIAHNHPGNNPEPSTQDVMMTINTLGLAGVVGLRLRDHIIVTADGQHYSIREHMAELESKLREAEEKMFGGTLKQIKNKLLQVLKDRGIVPPDAEVAEGLEALGNMGSGGKKGGDPNVNVDNDLEQSLSYKWLTL